MKNTWKVWAALALVLTLAGVVRFYDLSQAAVRSDEINFLNYAAHNQSLVDLWTTPPWFNQIPLADSMAILWARLTGQTVDESVIRQPFALLGWLTVVFCTVWMIRRRGLGAGLLLGVWMALLPLHVYHSREAYYYVLVMAFASGMMLRGGDFIVRLKAGETLKIRQYVEWAAWTLLACLSHMSVWVVAAAAWLLLATAGWRKQTTTARKRHLIAMGLVTAGLGAGLLRWVLRALHEMSRAAADSSAHIGLPFDWVGLRVLPVFVGGANGMGIALLAIVAIAFAWLLWQRRGKGFQADPLYSTMTALAFLGLAGSYTYIFFAGGGSKAKLTYFAANLPIFLAWAALTIHRVLGGAAGERGGRWHRAGMAAMTALVGGLLVAPAIQVVRLEGKPTPYVALRDWLDANLAPGDVAIVDRWLEPWNEMALYAPTNVWVNFTVPDEPYEQYVGNRWRETTRGVFEHNGAQAFIRLARNHESRMGLWTWPERAFARHAVVSNAPGLWLTHTGFAPVEEFYFAPNRLAIEIFYDTHADIAEKARRAGHESICFFGAGFRLFKPWQQGDWTDYRLLEPGPPASMEVITFPSNTAPLPTRWYCEVTAIGLGGPASLRAGSAPPQIFPADRMETRRFDLPLAPGTNTLSWNLIGNSPPCAIREIRFSPAKPDE